MSPGKLGSIAASSLGIRDPLSPSRKEYVPSAQGARQRSAAVCSASGTAGDKVSLLIKCLWCLPAGSELGGCSALLCVKGGGSFFLKKKKGEGGL